MLVETAAADVHLFTYSILTGNDNKLRSRISTANEMAAIDLIAFVKC